MLLAAICIGCGPDDDADSGNGDSSQLKGPAATGDSDSTEGGSSASGISARPDGVLPSFRMLESKSGFHFERYDDFQGQRRILETNGGGVAIFDFDGDGFLDTYLTSGCRLPVRHDDHDTPGQLFRNLGGMVFESAADSSRLMQFGHGHGCAVGDFNADGFDDLYITAFGRNTLWQNGGDGTFTDVTEATGTGVPVWSSSAAFADINNDGHLDLYVVNYLEVSDGDPKLCPDADSPTGYIGCSPTVFEGVDDTLFLSDGAGQLIDCSEKCGISGRNGKGLGLVILDFDADRIPEIYVANDGQPNFLFAQTGEHRSPDSVNTPKFEDHALRGAVAMNEAGLAQASMGVAAGDCDADGRPDLFLTHFFGDTNTLYLNQGNLLFEDTTRTSRLGTASRQSLGFGTAFLDSDNSGWLDLIVTNGHVDDRSWRGGEPYRMRPQIFQNTQQGSFQETSQWSGDFFQRKWIGRGLATGDLDRDGRIDAVISHQADASVILHNETEAGQSILLKLVGTQSNRNGLGTRVEVQTDGNHQFSRELAGGCGFQSANAQEIHLGIGSNQRKNIIIHWVSGKSDRYQDVQPGFWTAIEDQAELIRH